MVCVCIPSRGIHDPGTGPGWAGLALVQAEALTWYPSSAVYRQLVFASHESARSIWASFWRSEIEISSMRHN